MPKFKVTVENLTPVDHEIEVDAESEALAAETALNQFYEKKAQEPNGTRVRKIERLADPEPDTEE